ncbi:SDR family oxidoreductase, partial [Pseudomonas sihuiensis]
FPGGSHSGARTPGLRGYRRPGAFQRPGAGSTVTGVLRGNIATEGLEGMGEEYAAKMAASIPSGRLGKVEDIANAVLFFASREAGFITGQTIVVDGGQVLPESSEALG